MTSLHHNHPESDERPARKLAGKNLAAWENFTPDQQRIIGEIAAWQTATGLTDVEFLRGCSGDISVSTWSRLKRGMYPGKVAAMVEIVKRHAAVKRGNLEGRKNRTEKVFHIFPAYEQLREAVAEVMSLAEGDEEDKLVWFIGASGFGKTSNAKELCKEFGGWLITARQSWKSSYFSALRSICQEIGVKPASKKGEDETPEWRTAPDAEAALLHHLQLHPGLFILNETEDFGPPVLNLIKSILNETRCAVVIMCVPTFFTRIQERNAVYARQLMRRTEAVIKADTITPSMVEKFFTEHWTINAGLKDSARAVAKAANLFGGFDLIRRVRNRLLALHPSGSGTTPTDVEVQEAISLYREFVSDASAS